MTRPQLGAKVRVSAVAQRVAPTKLKRKWTSWPIPVVEGMYIGYRFKQNGEIVPAGTGQAFDGEYDDWPTYFACNSTQEVWLVVANPRHDPIMAFPEDCEVLP